MSYNNVLAKLKETKYSHFNLEESKSGDDVVTTVNGSYKIVPMQPNGQFRGVTLFIPVSHTEDVSQLVNTTAQVIHTINAMALTAVLLDAVLDCGVDKASTIMSILGMKSDSGLAFHRVRVMHVEGDYNIVRTSRKGMVTILISLRESLDIQS